MILSAPVTPYNVLYCPAFTPLTIPWTPPNYGYSINYYALIAYPPSRTIYTFPNNDGSFVAFSTATDQFLTQLNLNAYLFNVGMVYDSVNNQLVLVDQRGVALFLNPATYAVNADIGTGYGPGTPPNGYSLAYDSVRGLIVWSYPSANQTILVLNCATHSYTQFTPITSLSSWTLIAKTYNADTGKVVLCNGDSGQSYPYVFYDTGTNIMTASSLTIGPTDSINFIPQLHLLVCRLTATGAVYLIDSRTDTVVLNTGATVFNPLGGAAYDLCRQKLLFSASAVYAFDPANAYALSTFSSKNIYGFACDPWSGAAYGVLNAPTGDTIQKF